MSELLKLVLGFFFEGFFTNFSFSFLLYVKFGGTVYFAPTLLLFIGPPVAYLLIFDNFFVPNACTALLRITNSPGSSIAGTVSPLPVPGTVPPRLKPRTLPPLLNPFPSPPAPPAPPMPLFTAAIPSLPILKAANVAINGIRGLSDLATSINALARSSKTVTIALKLAVCDISRISALKFSVVLAKD